MRFMMIVNATKDSEAGKMPSEELLNATGKYSEELLRAGVFLYLAGLHRSAKGVRIQFANGKRSVIDGPFAETKELIAGYRLIEVKSKQEAIDWTVRVPCPFGAPQDGHIELRQVFELSDFAPSSALDRACTLGEELAKRANLVTGICPEAKMSPTKLEESPQPSVRRPCVENAGSFLGAGLRRHYTEARISDMPAQCQQFVGYLGRTPGRVGRAPYGVCFNPANRAAGILSCPTVRPVRLSVRCRTVLHPRSRRLSSSATRAVSIRELPPGKSNC